VCLAAGGCTLTGQFCSNAQQCCGGGTNPNGSVQCDGNRCDNGQSCNPVGNICGAPVLPDGGKINASQNCCNGMKDVCKLDGSGIPRCFGGGSVMCPTGYTGQAPCCIEPGNLCQFRDQCCNGAACVPGSDGGVQCVVSSCVPPGGACTEDGGSGNCCAPLACSGGACRLSEGGVDGGASDAGQCLANLATCTSSAQCCSLNCTNGMCGPARVCQPLGGVCTATADCCTGTTCAMAPGTMTGTCQPSACVSVGQACTQASGCCTGLSCLASTGAPCGPTGACTCVPIIQ
jgi:hypothetical protein